MLIEMKEILQEDVLDLKSFTLFGISEKRILKKIKNGNALFIPKYYVFTLNGRDLLRLYIPSQPELVLPNASPKRFASLQDPDNADAGAGDSLSEWIQGVSFGSQASKNNDNKIYDGQDNRFR